MKMPVFLEAMAVTVDVHEVRSEQLVRVAEEVLNRSVIKQGMVFTEYQRARPAPGPG